MTVDDLKILNAIAKYGSMSRAASELNTVQSNVTSKIRALEDELGVQLFIRKSRGVEPTDAGRRLLGYSERITALLQEAIAAVKEDGSPKGSLRVGTTESTLVTLLPRIVSPYMNKFPAVDLSVSTGNTTSLVDQVVEGHLDGAFVAGPVDRRDIDHEHILTEELVVVSPASLTSLDSIRILSNFKLIGFYSECSYRQRLDVVLKQLNANYRVMEFDSLRSLMSCVGDTAGITLLPKALAKDLPKHQHVVLHSLPEEQATGEVVFIRRHDRTSTAALRAFLELTKTVCRFQRRELSPK